MFCSFGFTFVPMGGVASDMVSSAAGLSVVGGVSELTVEKGSTWSGVLDKRGYTRNP